MNRMVRTPVTALTLGFIGAALIATAAEPTFSQDAPQPRQFSSKASYTLFHPTPSELMRDLSPDRPDTTESPYSVDAGHYQLEFSFAEWRKEGGDEGLAILPANIKIGLTNNADLQFVFNPYLRSQTAGNTEAGHGDTQIRLKVNLWGNDGGNGFFGETALAVIPFIQLPTGADAFSNDDHLEWGVLVPFSMPLPADFGLTAMAEIEFVRDGNGGYDTLFVHTASISREIFGPLAGYIEYIGVQPIDGDRDYQAAIGGGLTYELDENTLLDAGIEAGLNAAADDLRLFAGMTLRL
jgi:hypothetical protein